MSDSTKAAMERAIEAHIADEHDDNTVMLKAYILQAAGSGLSDERDLLCYCGLEGQSGLLTAGLLVYAQTNVENLLFNDDDDD